MLHVLGHEPPQVPVRRGVAATGRRRGLAQAGARRRLPRRAHAHHVHKDLEPLRLRPHPLGDELGNEGLPVRRERAGARPAGRVFTRDGAAQGELPLGEAREDEVGRVDDVYDLLRERRPPRLERRQVGERHAAGACRLRGGCFRSGCRCWRGRWRRRQAGTRGWRWDSGRRRRRGVLLLLDSRRRRVRRRRRVGGRWRLGWRRRAGGCGTV
mmetsp:Transcript_23137/g.71761  ORF Transcript_23137/g.71761 Transcript_23137/m.71761 type:complete len:212 (-) Transcript_23137:38-673(-)